MLIEIHMLKKLPRHQPQPRRDGCAQDLFLWRRAEGAHLKPVPEAQLAHVAAVRRLEKQGLALPQSARSGRCAAERSAGGSRRPCPQDAHWHRQQGRQNG